MIKNIKLKFGSSPSRGGSEIGITPITVFVGPNNSGKSRVLVEIENSCRSGNLNQNQLILDNIEFEPFSVSEADTEVKSLKLEPLPDEFLNPNHSIFGKYSVRHQLRESDFLQWLLNPNSSKQAFCQYYVSWNTLRLDGNSRITLVNPQGGINLQNPAGHLSVLFTDDKKRIEVRRILHDAFSKYFVIDPTTFNELRIRFSEREPVNHEEERGLNEAAVNFHKSAQNIELFSDGVRAFTGIVINILAGDPKIILVDEPEAFLHPSLSRKLGKEMGLLSSKSSKKLFVSTHSAGFLMGCIQSGSPMNIVRLTYLNKVPTARVLPSENILKLMRNPLLRSTGVLDGLFHESVIVTEADSDRAFYQEINERLLTYVPEKGISNTLFINAQNKQTIHQIIKPLRELGIPAVAIVDIDIMKDSTNDWNNLLLAAFIPEPTRRSFSTSRSLIAKRLKETGRDIKKDGGVDLLSPEDQEAFNNLCNQLSEYGIFIVRKGELEFWLKELKIDGHGNKWLINVFEKLGENPSESTYIKPTEGDVWNFVKEIKNWVDDPNRKGIPD